MGHVETQGLQHWLAAVKGQLFRVPPQILGEQLARLLQRGDVLPTGLQLPRVHVLPLAVFLQKGLDEGFSRGGLIPGDHVISHLVHQVDRAAVDVQDDIVPI